MRNLVARSDPCGRVWIEDAEHGWFPPDGVHIRFPQHERKRAVEATLRLARCMAAAPQLLEELKRYHRAAEAAWHELVDSGGDEDLINSGKQSLDATAALIAKAEEAA